MAVQVVSHKWLLSRISCCLRIPQTWRTTLSDSVRRTQCGNIAWKYPIQRYTSFYQGPDTSRMMGQSSPRTSATQRSLRLIVSLLVMRSVVSRIQGSLVSRHNSVCETEVSERLARMKLAETCPSSALISCMSSLLPLCPDHFGMPSGTSMTLRNADEYLHCKQQAIMALSRTFHYRICERWAGSRGVLSHP